MNRSDFIVGQTVYLKTISHVSDRWNKERIVEGVVSKRGVSFRGAYHEDFYLDDDKIYFVDGDIVYNKEYCCADCKALKLVKRIAKYIAPRYTIRGWQFDANFPHAYFPITKDGVAFGEGIVFAYEDVGGNSQNA